MEILESIKQSAANLSTLEIITVVGTVQRGGYDGSKTSVEYRQELAQNVITAIGKLSDAKANKDKLSAKAKEDAVKQAQKKLNEAKQAERAEILKQAQEKLYVNYEKNNQAIVTQINLIQGDIKNVVGPKFIEEQENYQSVKEFHYKQVEKGHTIVKENIEAIKSLVALVQETLQP